MKFTLIILSLSLLFQVKCQANNNYQGIINRAISQLNKNYAQLVSENVLRIQNDYEKIKKGLLGAMSTDDVTLISAVSVDCVQHAKILASALKDGQQWTMSGRTKSNIFHHLD